MKVELNIGMIFECTRGGPDAKVGEHFVGQFLPGAVVHPVCMTNKANLIRDCGQQARFLFEQRQCENVFVVWDLAPAWPDQSDKRCRRRDKAGIERSFKAAYGTQVPPWDRIVLLCVEQMLESWLVADARAVTEHLSRPTHPAPRFSSPRRPDEDRDPKARLIRYFREVGRNYNEHTDALPIIQRASPSMLERSPSFLRLKEKLSRLAMP